jgi:hypothetical protein
VNEQRIPWYVWCSVAAVTSAVIGIHWDISWHRSIGRDTFWTPAHVAIHLCGVLAGISCGYLILATTFNRQSPLRKCSVRVWGFYGPLGSFIAAWGGIAMITSAPFDNWWHNAYGLDVKILSPPHAVLAVGLLAVHAGTLILILGQMNRADGPLRRRLRALFLYTGGLILISLTVLQMEITTRSDMHTVHFYGLISMVAPLVMAAVAAPVSIEGEFRWGATTVAAVYTAILLLFGWILPLFPAEPKLGPVYHQVTQFVPPEFPLLLLAPAISLDLLWRWTAGWGTARRALISAAVFLAVFGALQWPFANFLMSPGARNWFFGTKYFGYYVHPNSNWARYQFVATERGAEFWREAGVAVLTATLTSGLGLAWGNWMQRIRR